eukprot:NODE_559_length_6071_cov_0.798895.p3 type:complete len:271 gc:universal NODE_559_length_6071_cov_0.798895:2502-1690(-)
MSNQRELQFKQSDSVLAYYGDLLYKAKISEVNPNAEKCYLVHYHGWSNRFDEWYDPSNLLELTLENKELQKQLSLANSKTKKRYEPRKSRKGSKSSQEAKFVPVRTTLYFSIPDSLKEILLDDREQIAVDRNLVTYEHSVSAIIETYKESVTDTFFYIHEYLDGLVSYFDHSLGSNLLYLQERIQYQDFLKEKDFKSSNIYGLQHFLRLFTILPSLMPLNNVEKGVEEEFQQFTENLLVWISENSAKYLGKYFKMSSEYEERLKSAGINI